MRKFFKRLIVAMEKSAQKRADYELRRLGYTPKKLEEMMTK